MADNPEPIAAIADAFLEAHFYDGGLRIAPLGLSGARPDWAPEPESVGFRDEFGLGAQDVAVEFSRLLKGGRRLTWLAVYERSVDRKFGDRSNHAGVGVWLAERHLADPEGLLAVLEQFARSMAEGLAIETLQANASRFLADHLGTYLLPSDQVPEALGGWPFLPQGQALTQGYVAPATEKRRFRAAADRLIALSYLPSPSPQHGRAVMLVSKREAADASQPSLFAAEQNDAKILPLLLRQVPIALGVAQAQVVQLAATLNRARASGEELSHKLEATRTKLGSVEEEREALTREKAALEKEISGSDTLSTIRRVSGDLDLIKSHTSQIGPHLAGLERALRQSQTAGRSRPRLVESEGGGNIGRGFDWVTFLIGAAVSAALILLSWAIYSRLNRPEPDTSVGLANTHTESPLVNQPPTDASETAGAPGLIEVKRDGSSDQAETSPSATGQAYK